MTSTAVDLSVGAMPAFNACNTYGTTGGADTRLVTSLQDMQNCALNLLEELEAFATEDMIRTNGELNQLIGKVYSYLKTNGNRLDEDSGFKQQMDLSFNVLRNILRNLNLNPIHRTMLLEVIELRATNWSSNADIIHYYQKKMIDLKENHCLVNDLNDGLKLSHSSSSMFAINDVLKPSSKLNKSLKGTAKTALKSEVIIRNSDSGKVAVGAKERVVQITGSTEENIECAKDLIEDTIKRNASPIPLETSETCLELNQKWNEISGNETIEKPIDPIVTENDNKFDFCFTLNVAEEVLQLSTNNYNLGLKAKQLLEKHFIFNESKALMESMEKPNEKSKESEKVPPNEPKVIQIQKSSSQGTVPIGRTSMRFMKPKDFSNEPNIEPNVLNGKITYDRPFLVKCSLSPWSREQPNLDLMSKLLDKTPEIVQNFEKQTTLTSDLILSRSYPDSNGIENW